MVTGIHPYATPDDNFGMGDGAGLAALGGQGARLSPGLVQVAVATGRAAAIALASLVPRAGTDLTDADVTDVASSASTYSGWRARSRRPNACGQVARGAGQRLGPARALGPAARSGLIARSCHGVG